MTERKDVKEGRERKKGANMEGGMEGRKGVWEDGRGYGRKEGGYDSKEGTKAARREDRQSQAYQAAERLPMGLFAVRV